MSDARTKYPVIRLVGVRVAQSTVGVLIVLVGDAGVPVVATAMIGAGVALGFPPPRDWTRAHAHAGITGLVLAVATAGHTLAVLNAPVATVETIVQAAALLPLAASPVQRRRPAVVALVTACIAIGALFVGFAGGSSVGIALAGLAGVAAAALVMRLETRPNQLRPSRYQSLSLVAGGVILLPFGLALGDTELVTSTALVLVLLTAVFAITNLELGKVVPATGAVIAMSSSGLRPIAALFLGALIVDQGLSLASTLLGVTYGVAFSVLVRQVKIGQVVHARAPAAAVPTRVEPPGRQRGG